MSIFLRFRDNLREFIMNVALQNSEAWLGTLNDDILRKCPSIQLIGGDGLSTFIPMQFLKGSCHIYKKHT